MNSSLSKKHGMKDKRWTIQDKLGQYKGLVKLSQRDLKLYNSENIVTEKKLSKNLNKLKNDFKGNCKALSNAIKCDPITQNSILSKDNKLQRLCKDFHPSKTIEYLEHKNFNKRKLLDRLNVTYKKKLEELCNQKLELAKIEESKAHSAFNNAEHDSKLEAISGKIQEYEIKRDAAIQIKTTYKGILNILNKDSVYFNQVIGQLNADIKNQGKCIHTATVVGQIAVEQADDQKQEYISLNRSIKHDYRYRINTIEVSKKNLKHLQSNFKNAIGPSEENQENDNISMKKYNDLSTQIEEIQKLKKTLKTLQEITHSNSLNDILPCMKKQLSESRTLIDICSNYNTQRNDLLHKLIHAKISYSDLQNETSTETFEYMQTKKELKKMLQKAKNDIDTMTTAWNEDNYNISRTQAAVVHLYQLCKNINLPVKLKNDENENLIEDLCLKLSVLMSTVEELDIEIINAPFTVQKCYEKFFAGISSQVADVEKSSMNFSDIEEFSLPDPNVHTYKSIKEQSKRTVEENKINI